MRVARISLIVLLFCLAALAQDNPLAPGQQNAPVPVVTFEMNWPAADPQWYRISIASTGTASYQSQPQNRAQDEEKSDDPGDPFTLKFIASEPTRTRVFQLAKSLNHFNGNFETKHKVAQTGTKTLTYLDDGRESHTTLNYSDNPEMNELIELFQRISSTFETSRRLDYDLRFDRLGLDRDLKTLENLDSRKMLVELQVIAPTLERIASDPAVMNIARQRARKLLSNSSAAASSR